MVVFLKKTTGSVGPGLTCWGLIPFQTGSRSLVVNVMAALVSWEKLGQHEREEAIAAALSGPTRMQRVLLRALAVGDITPGNTDRVVDVLLCLRSSPEQATRILATTALGRTFRRDVVRFLVEALEDDVVTTAAWGALRHKRMWLGVEDPPQLAGLSREAEIGALRQWWADVGSRRQEFKEYVPRDGGALTARPTDTQADPPMGEVGAVAEPDAVPKPALAPAPVSAPGATAKAASLQEETSHPPCCLWSRGALLAGVVVCLGAIGIWFGVRARRRPSA